VPKRNCFGGISVRIWRDRDSTSSNLQEKVARSLVSAICKHEERNRQQCLIRVPLPRGMQRIRKDVDYHRNSIIPQGDNLLRTGKRSIVRAGMAPDFPAYCSSLRGRVSLDREAPACLACLFPRSHESSPMFFPYANVRRAVTDTSVAPPENGGRGACEKPHCQNACPNKRGSVLLCNGKLIAELNRLSFTNR